MEYVKTDANGLVIGFSTIELEYCNEPVSNWEDVAAEFDAGMEGIYVRDGIATFEPTESDLERIAEREEEEDKKIELESLPDVVAELSLMVSNGASDTAALEDVVAELSVIVSTLVEGA